MSEAKAILIGVTGSIAAYKSCDLVRELVKKGYPVRVIMSPNAERFVGKVSFQALSSHRVYSSEWEEGMLHIDMKRLAALYAIVPATANMIGKLANGIADDIISSVYLCVDCPVVLAPSMNPQMYIHSALQRNLEQLQDDGVHLIDPQHGEAVCGDQGQGKMATVNEIAKVLMKYYDQSVAAM